MPNSQQPTTRSRTLLFLSYRDSTARTSRARPLPFASSSRTSYRDSAHNGFAPADDERERLIFNADDDDDDEDRPGHVALDVHLPPKWVDISDQVHDILAAAQGKIFDFRVCLFAPLPPAMDETAPTTTTPDDVDVAVAALACSHVPRNGFFFLLRPVSLLERLHAKHVLPGFADRSAEEREIEAVTTDITRDFRRCQSLIQSIPSVVDQSQRHAFPPRSHAQAQQASRHEQLAAQNVQRALAAKVQELSATFRKKQRVYLETLQGHAIKNQDLLVASGALTLKGPESISDLDEDMRVASQNASLSLQQQQHQQEALEDIDSTVLQRDREISEIAKSINALAELFKDLSTLVIDQGTLLDSVEYNIEQTAVNMQEAVEELKVAEGYQRNTGRRKCICLLLLIIFGLVVVLIFKPRRHSVPTTGTGSSSLSETSKTSGQGEELPPIPIDVTTLDPESIGTGEDDTVRRRALDEYAPSSWSRSRSTRPLIRVLSGGANTERRSSSRRRRTRRTSPRRQVFPYS